MNCRSAEERIQESLDGALTADERTRLDSHLASCAVCQTTWEAHRRLARAARHWAGPLPQDDPGDVFTARVLSQITASPVPTPVRRPLWLPLGATVLLLAILAWLPGLLWPILGTLGVTARQTPGWLMSNVQGVPGDASGVWTALTTSIPIPAGVWAALLLVVAVNGMFCVQARLTHARRGLP